VLAGSLGAYVRGSNTRPAYGRRLLDLVAALTFADDAPFTPDFTPRRTPVLADPSGAWGAVALSDRTGGGEYPPQAARAPDFRSGFGGYETEDGGYIFGSDETGRYAGDYTSFASGRYTDGHTGGYTGGFVGGYSGGLVDASGAALPAHGRSLRMVPQQFCLLSRPNGWPLAMTPATFIDDETVSSQGGWEGLLLLFIPLAPKHDDTCDIHR
jgi:hypothetical protein